MQVLGVGPTSEISDELNAERGMVVLTVRLIGAIITSDLSPIFVVDRVSYTPSEDAPD